MKKILYIILDGLGDRPHPDLDGKTPLEAADIPNINSLAKKGKMGLVHTVKEGVAPESDVAVMSLLGYDAEKYYPGRGPLETQGAGIEMSDGDLALRGNFATGTSEGIIINRRVARSLETIEGKELAKAINESVELVSDRSTFKLVSTISYRNVLVIKRRSGNLSGKISNTDPAYNRVSTYSIAKEEFEMRVCESRPLEENEEARIAAKLVNEFTEKSKKILSTHPINIRRTREGKLPANLILLRDAGSQKPSLPKITDLYGVEFGCLVELPVEKGIAELSGMEVFSIPLVENTLSEHYQNMAQTTVSTLKRKQGVYVHIKGPDEPGHDGLAKKKQKIIEDIDKYFFTDILEDLNLNEVVVAITSDHSTPCTLKAHSSDPVPLLLLGPGIESDGLATFSEKVCRDGSLGIINGHEIMSMLVRYAKNV